MSDSVGKISLDLEVKSDLMDQINDVSSTIGKNLKNALGRALGHSSKQIGKTVSAPLESASKAINNTMDKGIKSTNKSTKAMVKNTSELIKRTFSDTAEFGKNAIKSGTKGALSLAGKVMNAFRMKNVAAIPKFSAPTPAIKERVASPRVTRGPPKGSNPDITSSQMASIEKEMDLVERKISTHKLKLKDLKESYESAFNPNIKSGIEEKIQKEESGILRLEKSMDTLAAKYAKLENAMNAFNSSQSSASRAADAASRKIGGFNKSVLNSSRNVKKARPVLTRLSTAFKNVGKSSGSSDARVRQFGVGLRGSLGQMMKWMIVLPAIASGIKKFASSLLSSLMTNEQFVSSLNQIKSNLMVAFTPIYNAILPAVNALMNTLATATGYIASFISLLFGKSFQQSFEDTKSLVAAKDAMGAYGGTAKKAGDDIKAAGKAAKEAQRDILGFDRIEKLSDNSDSDMGGGGDNGSSAPPLIKPPNMTALDAAMSKWVKKFKDILSQLFKPFGEAWAAEGMNTINAIKEALNSVWGLIKAIGRSFLEVWTNGTGTLVLKNILVIFQNILKVIGNIASRLQEAWEKNNTGTKIIQSIFNIFNTILGAIRNITGATVEWSKKLDFTPLLTSIQQLLKALEPLAANIGAGLEWFWNNVLLPIAGWTIQTAVPTFLDMLAAAIDAVNSVIDALKPLGSWLFDNFLKPLAEFTGGMFISVMKTITNLLKKFSDWCQEHQGTVRTITTVVLSFMAAWEVTKLLAFIQTSGGVVSALGRMAKALFGATAAKVADKAETMALTALYAKDFIVSIAKGTAELVRQAAKFAIATAAKVADAIAQAALTLATTAWSAVCGIATAATTALGMAFTFLTGPIGIAILIIGALIAVGILLYKNWDAIKAKAAEVWDAVKSKFNEFKEFLSGVFTRDWTKDFGVIGEVFNAFFKSISNIWDSIKEIFGGIIDFVAGVFTGNWKRAWNGIKNIFKGIFDGMASFVKSPINAIIALLNGLITGVAKAVNSVANMFNHLRIKIPSWVPGVGGKSLGFNIPTWSPSEIPYLAKGGVIEQPTLAMMGESGKEAVVPLERNREWIKRVSDEMQRQQGSGSGELTPEMVSLLKRIIAILENLDIVKIDEESLRKYFIKVTNKNTKATGECELLT